MSVRPGSGGDDILSRRRRADSEIESARYGIAGLPSKVHRVATHLGTQLDRCGPGPIHRRIVAEQVAVLLARAVRTEAQEIEGGVPVEVGHCRGLNFHHGRNGNLA